MVKPVKDSGERQDYASGMRRDTQEGKPDFRLIIPLDVPYEKLWITQLGHLMRLGAEKYGERNWEKANSKEELLRFQGSAYRHMMQAMSGEDDENHLAAVIFNVIAWMTLEYKLGLKKPPTAEEVYGNWNDMIRKE